MERMDSISDSEVPCLHMMLIPIVKATVDSKVVWISIL